MTAVADAKEKFPYCSPVCTKPSPLFLAPFPFALSAHSRDDKRELIPDSLFPDAMRTRAENHGDS